ncbi:hypothetical protein CBE01nite_29580 [Clostridium beijerinckii]|uniref:Uncharacterized protein n=1 Tax=Clostridium beijerinckii TaxID=1520 RepID=A0AB74VDD0_CLOBE|nr:hypothetical protein [Clostridium beijerinckii]NRZ28738.1 putative nucleic acid-binding protein [Clostridium beijerinckii]NYB95486.1 putative nucleic acid-binding protein [Clostridium beijerinckii]OOM19481.1 hypothetical protein CLBEI_50070 [Clostridium beijerinckii]QUN34416.1 hypothetical protein KEC93_21205 [Clostridium beijerinckii]SQB00630.1 Uncharacterised protein [Clostridium beijerinckii]
MKKIIYLDQNKWIELSQCFYGKSDKHRDVLGVIIEKTNSGEWIFPISIIHHIETEIREQDVQRQKLAKFMGVISKNWTIKPNLIDRNNELECNFNNKCYNPIKQDYLNVIGQNLDDVKITLNNRVLDTNIMENLKQSSLDYNVFEEFIEIQHNTGDREEQFADNEFHKETLEYFRKESEKNSDKSIEDQFIYFYMDCFKGEYSQILRKILPENQNKIAYKMYKQKLPKSFYVKMKLIFESVIKNKERKIDKNDFKDIMFLSMAIPYCDVVITERFWTGLITENGLDKMYDTVISKNIDKLIQL